MTFRCGISLRGDEAVAVRVRRGRVLVSEHAVREPGEEWERFLARLIHRVRGTSWMRPRVGVIVDDRRCRVGPLYGESLDTPSAIVAGRFASNPLAFLIGGADALVAGNVWRAESGWLGVTLCQPLAEALRKACCEARTDLIAVAPGPDEAYGMETLASFACGLRPTNPVTVDLVGPDRAISRARRQRLAMLAGVVISLSWAAAAPAWSAYRSATTLEQAAAESQRALSALRARAPGEGDQWVLREAVRGSTRDRGRATALLAGIAQVLPESTAITALRADEAGGSVTIVAPRVADAIAALTRVAALRNARVNGAIVSESYNGTELQRATLTWRQGAIGRRHAARTVAKAVAQ